MKKTLKFLLLATLPFFLLNCQTTQDFVVGRSTMNPVFFEQLELEREDYEILKTVTATATVNVEEKMSGLIVVEENDEFELKISGSNVDLESGVLKFGYLTNDIGRTSTVTSKTGLMGNKQTVVTYVPKDPESIARRLAKYRLINEAKAMGGDGVIEPVISSDIAKVNKDNTVIKTTIAAKVIVLKTDR